MGYINCSFEFIRISQKKAPTTSSLAPLPANSALTTISSEPLVQTSGKTFSWFSFRIKLMFFTVRILAECELKRKSENYFFEFVTKSHAFAAITTIPNQKNKSISRWPMTIFLNES